ncbi:sugar kinase [Amycolatopsis taiwanensis]|uniref:sugar kinase n=1 Tax=Amycolatopsis taiwanensis TaxID=342230 RepID=UPI0004867B9D|nr:sugar kinase [Amycolatopsis taiwanensis]
MLVTLGEPLAVFTSGTVGPARVGDHYRLGLGGAECNAALGARRLGTPSAVLGRVGDDPLGTALIRAMRADDIDVRAIARDTAANTGVMFKEFRSAGRVRVSYARHESAGSRLAPEDLDPSLLGNAQVLHTTGITASFGDRARAAIGDAMAAVHRTGGIVSFDVNYRRRLWPGPDEAVAALGPLIARADVLFLTLAEAELFGVTADPADAVRKLRQLGPRRVVLKVDAARVVAADNGEILTRHRPPVQPVDPVGAGDAFAAGYLHGLLTNLDPVERLDLAMTLGRWAATTSGDNEGLPTFAELDLLLEDDVAR